MDASWRSYLISGGYYFEEIASPQNIGTNCDLLILHTPKADITAEEATALRDYLANGGKVFLVTSCYYPDMPNLHSVTREFGLDVMNEKNIVCEQDTQYHYSAERPDYFLAHIASCEITKDFSGYFAVMTAHAIKIEETAPAGVTVFPLLYTGETTGSLIVVYENGEEGEEKDERYVTGAVAQKGEGTLVWLASPESATATGYSLSNGGNFTLIRASLNWMTGNTYAPLSIPSTLMTTGSLAIDTNGVTVLGVMLILVVPLAFIIPSIVYLYKRKKR
jgi:ABC-2 type transport system permease protein